MLLIQLHCDRHLKASEHLCFYENIHKWIVITINSFSTRLFPFNRFYMHSITHTRSEYIPVHTANCINHTCKRIEKWKTAYISIFNTQ